jgi:hypothetical protein
VAIDGTRLRANASKHRNVTYARAGELIELLKSDIAELLEKAERADTSPEQKEALPEELARREKLREKLEAARTALEERARQRAQREQAAYEARVQARAQREGRCKGPEPQPPRSEPEPRAQINLSDAESRLMRKSRNEAFEQSYNAQAAVCAGGSQLIVGARVSASSTDANELEPTLAAIPAAVGTPACVLIDGGYLNSEPIARVEASGTEVYCAVSAEAALAQRRYEFRPADRRRENPREPRDPRLLAMKAKLASPLGRAIYARRQTSVGAASTKSAVNGRWWLWPTTANGSAGCAGSIGRPPMRPLCRTDRATSIERYVTADRSINHPSRPWLPRPAAL